MVCMSSLSAARGDAAAARLAHGRPAQHRLVRRLRRDARARRPSGSTPRRSATCSPTSSGPRELGAEVRAPAGRATRWRRSSTSRARTASATSSSAARTSRWWRQLLGALRCRCGWCARPTGFDLHIVSLDDEERAHDPARQAAAGAGAAGAGAGRWSARARGAHRSRRSGAAREAILADNYRSVLAAQRMKEALERIDRAALLAASPARREARRARDRRAQRSAFERELGVQEGNITEPRRGRGDRARCARAGTRYRARFDAACAAPPGERGARPLLRRARAGALAAASGRRATSSRSTRTRWCARATARARSADAHATRDDRCSRSPRSLLGVAAVDRCSPAALLRPLAVLRAGGAPHRRGRPRRARARRRAATRSRSSPTSSTPWPSGSPSTARARSASCCRRSRRRRRRSTACPIRCSCSTPTASVLNVNRAAETLLGVDAEAAGDAARARSSRRCATRSSAVRAHVLRGQGRLRAAGASRRRCAVRDARRRALLPAARHPGLRRGRRRRRRDGGPAGRDPPAPLRRAARTTWWRPWRTSSARRSPRCAWRSTCASRRRSGRSPTKQADLLYAAREDCERLQAHRRRAARPVAHPGGPHRAAPRAASPPRALVAARARRAPRAARRQAASGARAAARRCPDRPVRADPERVQLVFANLLANAIRHTPARRSRRAARGARATATVRFEVARHRARASPPEHLPRALREVLSQSPGAPAGGAGLGLSIARRS